MTIFTGLVVFTWCSWGPELVELTLVVKMSWRPWTESAKRLRYMKGVKRKFPEPLKRWNIVRGDTVSDLEENVSKHARHL